MAKEYYSIKTQRIEFDTEKFTMTVTMHDEKFTVISVQTLNEMEFNSLYHRFKADYFSGRAVEQEADSGTIALSAQDAQKIENTPIVTTYDDFIQTKNTAFNVLSSLDFTPTDSPSV